MKKQVEVPHSGAEEPTALEKLTGNVITQAGLVAVAASVGTPLAALLPVLAGTLAAGRHRLRVEKRLLIESMRPLVRIHANYMRLPILNTNS